MKPNNLQHPEAVASPSSHFARNAVLVLIFSVLWVLSVHGQSAIYSEDFSGDSGSSTSTLTGGTWSATVTSGSGTLSITSGTFIQTGGSNNATHSCTWTSDPISISGYSGITLAYNSYSNGGGGGSITASMSNGSLSGGSFTPDAGATTTVLTFTIISPKNKYRGVDNIVVSGTITCTDTDGDGVCDDDEVDGCTDSSACNYDTAATDDDGSCIYATGCDYCSGATDGTGTVVTGSGVTFTLDITSDNYASETSWQVVDDDGGETTWSTSLTAEGQGNASTGSYTQCFPATGSYTFTIFDSANDGICCNYGSGSYTFTVDGTQLGTGGEFTTSESISIDFGCTDSGASNYDAGANVDNGTCNYGGCTDASACNYDASATTDDGSCTYATTWYADSDGDGAGDPDATTTACSQPAGYVAVAGDECPDDGTLQTAPTWYEDADGDGAGDPNSTTTACTQPAGYVAVAGDGCPSDPDKTSPGTCGCGTADTDTDSDGTADCNDTDDDNDGVLDVNDSAPLDPNVCSDTDGDGCDDCSGGSYDPANDGTDTDGDGLCNSGDTDDDGDGVADGSDSAPLDPNVCSDTDGDGCDDCINGSYDPTNDGTDTDGDGLCNSGDSDDDGDGVADGSDSDPLDPNVCSDTDGDGCDDCANGSYDPANDGTDTDGDGTCDSGDGCPSDPNKTAPGLCGCGNIDVDTNSNGVCDSDECIDSADPVAVAQDLTVVLDANGAVSITANDVDNGSSDDCALSSLALDITAFDCSDVGTPVTVTLTATDASGNTHTDTAVITVVDQSAPSVTASNASISLSAGTAVISAADLLASGSDNCTASPTVELSADDANWSNTLTYGCADLGPQTIYVRATDGSGNVSTTVSVTATIVDDTAPVIDGLTAGLSEALSSSGTATIDAASYISATDDCTASGSLIYEMSATSGSGFATTFAADCDDLGTQTFYFRVTDASGNVSAESSTSITIVDLTAPNISATSGGTIELAANGGATVTASSQWVTAADNCGGLSYTVSRTPGGTFASSLDVDCSDLGALDLYFKVADASGNVSAASSAVSFTIVDVTGPVTLASSATVSLDANGDYTLIPSVLAATATDNCSASVSFTLSKNNVDWSSSLIFGCDNLGSNTVYVRASDGTNEGASVAVTLTIEDTTGPAVTASNANLALGPGGSATIAPGDLSASATDNCASSPTIELSHDALTWSNSLSFDCDSVGDRTVYVRASDGTQYGSTTSAVVSVMDNIDPVAVANAMTLNLEGASVSLSASNATFNTSTDNCGIVSSSITVNGTTASSVDFTMLGLYTVTLTVTDASGNTGQSSAQVTVTSAPTVLYSEDFEDASLLSAGDMCGSGTVAAANGNFSASCQASDFIGVVSYNGSQQFTWEDADGAGWLSPQIDISGYIADVSADIEEESNIDATDYLTMYISIDGGDFVMYDQRNRCSCTHVPFSETGFMGSTLQILVLGMNDQNENWYMDNVLVQGCVDQDGDGICDPVDSCVDFPAGTCGCTDATACNFDSGATSDDGSCKLPGSQCAAPSGTTGYVNVPNAAGDGCDCDPVTMVQLYSEPFDDEVFTDEAGTFQTICSGYTANGDNWTIACSGTGGVFIFPAAQSGTDLDLNVYQSADNIWTTADIDVSGYVNAHFSSLVSDAATLGTADGWTVSAIEDGTNTGTIASIFDDVVADTPLSGDVEVGSTATLNIAVEGDAAGAGKDIYMDDVLVYGYGVKGCTDANATNYSASANLDDGSCVLAEAYSRYSGGFGDKLWSGSACGGSGCGNGPYLDAVLVAALSQTDGTNYNYTISSGTTLTVDGTLTAADNPMIDELFVRNLTIEDGGALVIPAGKRLRVMGTFTDFDGNAVSGAGSLCIDGTFTIPTGEDAPDSVAVFDFMVPADATLSVPEGKTLLVKGDLAFGATDPLGVAGLVTMSGTQAQTISGDGATLDALRISNTLGVTVSDSLEIQGRLTLDASTTLDMGSNWLVFASNPSSGDGEEEKTAVLDMIPASASLTGVSTGGRLAQSANAEAKVQVERYIASDTDGVTFSGYTLFASPIDGAQVADLDNIDGFYLAGWADTDYPNSFSTVLFWDEANSAFVEPTSNSQSLSAYGGSWIAIAGSQTPTMVTSGALNSHVENSSKTFTLTRSGPTTEFKGWNLVYNPYQARLDWNDIIANQVNAAIIEDQYAVYDTQVKQFVRYSVTNTELTSAAQCIEPGQSFWVRVKTTSFGGSLTLTPSMIDNDGPESEFVRSTEEGEVTVVLETENLFGASRSVLRFGDQGDATAFVEGDLSRLSSSSVRAGELAFWADGEKYVAKSLPMAVDGDLFVRSRANYATTLRVVEVTGDPAFCAHIADHTTGETLLLQEGMEMTFTLPAHEAEEGRFTLHGAPFAVATGVAPDCPDSEAGAVLVELGDVVADLSIVDYEAQEEVALILQATGSVEVPVAPGEYAIHVDATEETSLCRGGRRQVVVFPGEQPELLGLEAMPAECNVGDAALAFELYGSGEFQTSLWQGAETVWQDALGPGEYVLEDLPPGDYVLKVDHTCMEAVEMVSLSDPGMPAVSVLHDAFVEVEPIGGAWLNAECVGCLTGDGFGYYWVLDGEIVAEDMPLQERVNSVGQYELTLVAYGPDCEMSVPFEMLVGKHKIGSPDDVRWLGMVEGSLMAVFSEEWPGAQLRWFDSAGRLLEAEQMGALLGESFLPVPDAVGWLTLEVRSADGRVARWSGIR